MGQAHDRRDPAEEETGIAEPSGDGDGAECGRSFLNDIETLVADGRIALEAELGFQKTRLAYVGQSGKMLAICTVVAVLFGHLALVAFTVGLLIALIPLVNAWLAMVIVTGLYVAVAGGCAAILLRHARRIRSALMDDAR